MRQEFADPRDYERVSRRRLAGRSITLEIGERRGRRELVAIEGSRADLQAAFDLFEDWHDRPPELVEIASVPDDTPPILVRIGDVRGILYRSDKWGHARGRNYIHETDPPFPGLYATPDRERVVILGGGMTVTPDGLEG